MGRLLPLLLLLTSSAFARLGDTRDQADARYGLPKKPFAPGIQPTLLEGAKEYMYEFEGWRIRCAALLAKDGKEYVVREEYQKIWNADVMKRGGVIQIRDFERDAILKGEAGNHTWNEQLIGKVDPDPLKAAANQFAHQSGLTGKVWVRDDNAVARMPIAPVLVLDLPQARKWEEDLKAMKDQAARASVPKF